MTIVQFAPFSSHVDPNFWHALTNLKVDILRLEDHAVPVSASYTAGRFIVDRETGNEISLGCNISVGGEAFSENPQYVHFVSCAPDLVTKNVRLGYLHILYPRGACSRTSTQSKSSRLRTRLQYSINRLTRCVDDL